MILLCGIPSEEPVALAARAAQAAGVAHVVLNQRAVGDWSIELEVGEEGVSGTLHGPYRSYGLEAFTGAYVRLVEPETLPEVGDPPRAEVLARARAAYDGLLAWLEVAPTRVANRLSASASNLSKPYQAQRIRRCGFEVVPTLVTNEPRAVRDFARSHGRLVYKSVSSVRSMVTELTSARAGNLERVRNLPTQFQPLVPGFDVRVHVVGAQVFATEIRTSAIDYRYAARSAEEIEMRAFELPTLIRERCRALSAALELPVCGIDLRRTPDGRWVCFEVNPSPAYSYYEEIDGQPIARALVAYLSGQPSASEEARASDDGAGDRELDRPVGDAPRCSTP